MFSVCLYFEVFIGDKIYFIHIFTIYYTKGIPFVKFELMKAFTAIQSVIFDCWFDMVHFGKSQYIVPFINLIEWTSTSAKCTIINNIQNYSDSLSNRLIPSC